MFVSMNYETLTYVNSILNKKSYIEISNDNLNFNKYMKLLSVYLIYVLYIYPIYIYIYIYIYILYIYICVMIPIAYTKYQFE